MTLGTYEIQRRAAGVGGSDANIILSNDSARILRLWQEKRGESIPDDLSDVLPVMLGSWTEAFNRQWFERDTGYLIEDRGSFFACEKHPWRRCTIDGYVPALKAVWEAKHTNAFATSEDVLDRYMPQLQHNMAVVGVERAVLSVIYGNLKWETYDVGLDWLYQEELLIAETRFWDCVRTGELPVPVEPPPAPKPLGVREMCLEGNNYWAAAAADWLVNRDAARAHSTAAAQIKSLVEDDVRRAYGHGIEAKRSRAGAITIRDFRA